VLKQSPIYEARRTRGYGGATPGYERVQPPTRCVCQTPAPRLRQQAAALARTASQSPAAHTPIVTDVAVPRLSVDGVLWVRESKSEDGRRAVALPPVLVEELARHKNRSPFNRDGEPVFASRTGNPFRAETFTEALRKALKAAGVDKQPRPFHDGRHGALTAMAKTGASPIAVMTTAGHASMQTTKRYLHLAGTVFPEEAAALERRLGLSTELSTDLTSPDRISGDPSAADTPQLRGDDPVRPM
jgi:Phage integrase family